MYMIFLLTIQVINVAGHRISSSAIEEAILEHHDLSECAVVELKDGLKGDIPFGFLIKTKSIFYFFLKVFDLFF